MKIKAYYHLTKPGIIYGNTIAGTAGYLLASQGVINWGKLVAFVFGLALVIACACVFNNIIDRDIDSKMKRTKKRSIVTGEIAKVPAFIYATILGGVGFILLLAFTNWLTALLGAIALVFYVVIYGIAKRKTEYGTLVGTVPGAIPPVAGYAAASGQLDLAAGLVFAAMVMWQMAHFYSIAIFRAKEYASAGIPVWAVKRGTDSTKKQIVGFVVLFIVVSLSLSLFGYTGIVYAFVMAFVGTLWLMRAIHGLKAREGTAWAVKMFSFSLIVLLAFCGALAVDAWLA
jgi:protoheme IX farnesyltransferase